MFEYISGKSIVHLLDPRTKILFLLIITILAVLIRDPVSLLFLFLATVIPLLLAGIPFGQLKKILLLYTLIVIGAVMSQAMFYVPKEGFTSGYIWLVTPDTPIIGIITGGIPLSLQGAVYGLIQSLRILAMVNASVALVMTTPLNRIIIGLRQLGIPSVFAFMLATAVRFVPTIIEEYKMICNALRARGLISPFHPVRFFEYTFTPLILNSVRRCMQLALAAESRAFGSEIKRTSYIEMQFTYSDIYVFIFIGILSSAIIFSAWHQGGLIF